MTKTEALSGMTSDGNTMKPVLVNFRATKDETGKTISLEDGEHMITIPVEAIENILKWLVK